MRIFQILLLMLIPGLALPCVPPLDKPRPGTGWWLEDEPTCDWIQVRCEKVEEGRAVRLAVGCPATLPAVAYTPIGDAGIRQDIATCNVELPALRAELSNTRMNADEMIDEMMRSRDITLTELGVVQDQLEGLDTAHSQEIRGLRAQFSEEKSSIIRTSVELGVVACILTGLATALFVEL